MAPSTARGRLRALLVLSLALALAAPLVVGRRAGAEAFPLASTPLVAPSPLAARAVADTFVAAGLPVNELRQERAGRGGPSGPPMTEREAWSFRVPEVAPSGGRILMFADDESLKTKADWFRSADAGAQITVHRNMILWLDPGIAPDTAARYRDALARL